MKTDIFLAAITSRRNLRFIYGLKEILIEPYYISTNDYSGHGDCFISLAMIPALAE